MSYNPAECHTFSIILPVYSILLHVKSVLMQMMLTLAGLCSQAVKPIKRPSFQRQA